ncbi:MAG TPA: phosphate acyltransferase PlsX [Phycisphaerae bacterium]|nr:phosphate acyltransferase PlsX [Phycisphaerae bacterium]
MRIGIDAMGGDCAPHEQVKGALASREVLSEGDRVVLIGDESAIGPCLEELGGSHEHIEIRHTDQAIAMDEAPVEALRTKPASSIAVMAEMHRDGEIDACISAGNTGAFVAAAQMRMRRLRGVYRPGIAIITPTFWTPVAVCDVGANVNCRPRHLYQYGVMASIYLRAMCGIEKPRVGLLSIGQEEAKGNALVKDTRDLLKDDPNVRFVGNVEGRDLFHDVCDVIVCEGFVGNVVVKLIEGMACSVLEGMLRELAENMPSQADAIRRASAEVINKYDYNEYGGAPLLGVAGICIICHGASNHRGIMNAVRVAKDFASYHINEQITELLSLGHRSPHG